MAVITITGTLSVCALDRTSLLFWAMKPPLLVGKIPVRLYRPVCMEEKGWKRMSTSGLIFTVKTNEYQIAVR